MGQNQQLINNNMSFTASVYVSCGRFLKKSSLSFIPLGFIWLMLFYWGSLRVQQGMLSTLEIYALLILVFILLFVSEILADNLNKPKLEHDQALLNEISDLSDFTNKNIKINHKFLYEITQGNFRYFGENKAVFKILT